jgi:DNA-binding GntR family transcriptional regulator
MAAAADRAYELLKQRLIGGSYAPGAQLKEEHLAQELAISRTPVRAALKRLILDGLATADAGRGVRAAQWTDTDIRETYRLRSLLEGYAAELAAQRGGKSLASTLHTLNQRMDAAIVKDGRDMAKHVQDINSLFHRALLEASGSARLRGLLASIIDMPIIVRSFFISTREDMQQSLQHHRDLAAAVEAKDGELASQAMQLHLRVAAQRFLQRRSEFVARDAALADDVRPPSPGKRTAVRHKAQDDC